MVSYHIHGEGGWFVSNGYKQCLLYEINGLQFPNLSNIPKT